MADEGVADAGMGLPGQAQVLFAIMAGEVTGDHVDRVPGVGLFDLMEDFMVGSAVAEGAQMVIAWLIARTPDME